MLLSNERVNQEIKSYMETNENGNIMVPNNWDAAKAILGVKFIAKQTSRIKKKKQTNPQTI